MQTLFVLLVLIMADHRAKERLLFRAQLLWHSLKSICRPNLDGGDVKNTLLAGSIGVGGKVEWGGRVLLGVGARLLGGGETVIGDMGRRRGGVKQYVTWGQEYLRIVVVSRPSIRGEV